MTSECSCLIKKYILLAIIAVVFLSSCSGTDSYNTFGVKNSANPKVRYVVPDSYLVPQPPVYYYQYPPASRNYVNPYEFSRDYDNERYYVQPNIYSTSQNINYASENNPDLIHEDDLKD